jgi:hypothetical protein
VPFAAEPKRKANAISFLEAKYFFIVQSFGIALAGKVISITLL